MIRIGQSTDIHRLKAGKRLIIGGIEIESEFGCVAHSDGDCLTHAIAEAILGALALGDLGTHFPDSDEQYKNLSSLVILKEIYDMMESHGFKIGNIDSTVLLEEPKLNALIPSMRKTLSEVLKIEISRINIKATTGEKVGIVGRKEAIVCEAVVVLEEA